MISKYVTTPRWTWRLTAQEVAHAMPVLQSVHPGLRDAPAPRLATIRLLAQRCGVRDGTLRTALSRACASETLALNDGRYALGPLAREEVAAAQALLARTRGYTVVVVPEGGRTDLPRLHELLQRFGFRPLQRSVWIGARAPDDRLGTALRRAGLGGSVVVFQADEVEGEGHARLAKLWRLKDRIAALDKFHRQLMGYLAEPRIAAREAAWRCVEAAPIWYRVTVQDEPPFPLDLRDTDYPLEGLNAAWRTHLGTMGRELVALWTAAER
jgi:DNA-binding transcriptional regulator PaaX